MIFWASSETCKPVGKPSERVRNKVEPYLNAAIEACSLVALEAKLRYVPIIMPEDMYDKYKERSQTKKKGENISLCSTSEL